MRINLHKNDAYSEGGFTSLGGQIVGQLILSRDPQAVLEATTKQYIDTGVTNILATNVKTGTLDVARFPALTGDITSEAGSGSISLNTTGIAANTYTKPTVNSKGRVTSGGNITNTDIPNLSWSKITSGKPTTLSGYGITDGLAKGGDTLTGFLTLNNVPTSNLEAANKQYVDNKASAASAYAVGDLVTRPSTITPSGFLRCNGGELSKTTYSALYAVVGDVYWYGNIKGSGQPWRQQYQFNTTQSFDISGWTTGTSLPSTRIYSQAVVTKNRVYLLGGYVGGSSTSTTVHTAPINADGTLGAWTTTTSLLAPINQHQAIVTKNRVYLIGGSINGTYNTNVYTAPINTDGTLGSWTTGTSLPASVLYSQAIVTYNRVYLLGGNVNGVNSSTVYTAPINTDGTLGAWSVGTSLPGVLVSSTAVVTKSRVYLLGGRTSSGVVSTVYTAIINDDGTLGTWTTGTSLPEPMASSSVIVTKNRVYLLGAWNANPSTGSISTVYMASINADGTLGSWVAGTSLPGILSNSQAIVTNSKIYLLGGDGSSGYSLTVYVAPVSGGLNDYSPYYENLILASDPSNFRLPDFTSKEANGMPYFIKY